MNYDLTRGSTARSIGFDNDELVAKGVQVFEVGLGTLCNIHTLMCCSLFLWQISTIKVYILIINHVQSKSTGSFEMLTTSRYVAVLNMPALL